MLSGMNLLQTSMTLGAYNIIFQQVTDCFSVEGETDEWESFNGPSSIIWVWKSSCAFLPLSFCVPGTGFPTTVNSQEQSQF